MSQYKIGGCNITWRQFEYIKAGVTLMAWTQEDRELVLRIMRRLEPDQQAQFPEDLQRGDRDFTKEEADKHSALMREWTPTKSKNLIRMLSALDPDDQAQFPEDVRQGERHLNSYETKLLEQITENYCMRMYRKST